MDGLIPLKTRDMDGEEEERRLFFVGITKGKRQTGAVLLYKSRERAMPGESRYIRMIPPRLLEGEEEWGPAVSLQELKRQVQEQRTQEQKRSLQEQKRSLQEQKRSLREEVEPAPTKRVRIPDTEQVWLCGRMKLCWRQNSRVMGTEKNL